jgi:hypothetical protein
MRGLRVAHGVIAAIVIFLALSLSQAQIVSGNMGG